MVEENNFEVNGLFIGLVLVEIRDFEYILKAIVSNQKHFVEEDICKYKEWAKEIEVELPLKDLISQRPIKW